MCAADSSQVDEQREAASRCERLDAATLDAVRAAALDSVPLVACDAEDRIVLWTPLDETLYQWSEKEALGHSLHELLRSELPIPWEDLKTRLHQHGQLWLTFTRHRRDGRTVKVRAEWKAVRDPRGEWLGIIERSAEADHELERQLQAAERNFRAFFELSGVGNVIADPVTGAFLRANRAFCDTVGYSEQELHGMTARDLTHPDDRIRDQEGWQAALARGDSHFTIEKRYVRRDGSIRWVSVTSTLVKDESDAPLHAMAVVIDIDARRRALAAAEEAARTLDERVSERTSELAEANASLTHQITRREEASAALSSANRTLETLIDASPAAIVSLDASHRIRIWSRGAEALFLLSEDAVRGRQIGELPLGWEGDAVAAIESAVRPLHRTCRVSRADGAPLELAIWGSPLLETDPGGGGLVLVILDESEKAFLEQALFAAAEREQRRIGQQLHDHLCQQLLGAAFGAQALARELQRTQSASEPRAFELARLINDSVIEARNMARGINPIELDEAGLMSALQEMSARSPLGVEMRFECPKPVLVRDSNVALHAFRIAEEATTNALRHAGATRVDISLSEEAGTVRLEILDNGPPAAAGTPAAEAEAQRLDIGIMRYRTDAIHGALRVASSATGGTSVVCTFPNPR